MRYVCEERWYTRGMQTVNGASGIRLSSVSNKLWGTLVERYNVVIPLSLLPNISIFVFNTFFFKESETFVDDLSLDKIPNIYRVTIEFGFLFCRSVIHWKLNATKSRPKKAYCMHSFEIYALSRDLIKLISTTENRGLYAYICSTRNFYRFLSVDSSEKNTYINK